MDTNLASSGVAVQAPARAQARWREVIIFGLLAYALAWAWWGFKLFPYLGTLLTAPSTPTDLVEQVGGVMVLILPGMFSPMIAALFMRIFISKEGLKGSFGLLRSWKYYLAALLAPAAFVTVVILVIQALSLGRFTWPEVGWLIYPMLMVNALPNVLFAFGEEYGWRGYLLPRLLPLGEIKASLLVGLIWGVWHAPVLFAGFNYPGANPWLSLIVFCFVTIALSFGYTWLYVASSGSVLIVAVLHASFNAFADKFLQAPLLSEGGQLAASLVAGVVMLTLVVVVYSVFKRSAQVEDPERFIHAKQSGTWRDWFR